MEVGLPIITERIVNEFPARRPSQPKGFKIERWLASATTFRQMVSEGFKIMEDLNQEELVTVLKQVFREKNRACLQEMIKNGLDLKPWSVDNIPGYTSVLSVALDSLPDDDATEVRYLLDAGCEIADPVPEARRPDLHDFGGIMRYYSHMQRLPTSVLAIAARSERTTVCKHLIHEGATIDNQLYAEIGRTLNLTLLQYLENVIKQKDINYSLIYYSCLSNPPRPYVHQASVDDNIGHLHPFRSSHVIRGKQGRPNTPEVHTAQVRILRHVLELERGVKVNMIPSGFLETLYAGHVIVDSNYEDAHKVELLRLVVEKGYDLDLRDVSGFTALHLATRKNSKPLVEFFLAKGADIDARDRKGKTPLFQPVSAHVQSPQEVIDLLIHGGADVTCKDLKGHTFLQTLLFKYKKYGVYEKEICRLLHTAEVGFSRPDVKFPSFNFCSWTVLSALVQAGCTESWFLRFILSKSGRINEIRGVNLVAKAAPGFLHRQDISLVLSWSLSDGSDMMEKVAQIKATVPSLLTLSAHQIRATLLKVTQGRSILPRLHQLCTPEVLPPGLDDYVTLKAYAIRDVGDTKPRPGFESVVVDYLSSGDESSEYSEYYGHENMIPLDSESESHGSDVEIVDIGDPFPQFIF